MKAKTGAMIAIYAVPCRKCGSERKRACVGDDGTPLSHGTRLDIHAERRMDTKSWAIGHPSDYEALRGWAETYRRKQMAVRKIDDIDKRIIEAEDSISKLRKFRRQVRAMVPDEPSQPAKGQFSSAMPRSAYHSRTRQILP